jgi:hypothetical protein
MRQSNGSGALAIQGKCGEDFRFFHICSRYYGIDLATEQIEFHPKLPMMAP